MTRREALAEMLIEYAYWEISGEKMLTIQLTGPFQARVPSHWYAEALERALGYADAVLEQTS